MKKTLNCKVCGEEIEVPATRVSAVCEDCAERALAIKELNSEIECLIRQIQHLEEKFNDRSSLLYVVSARKLVSSKEKLAKLQKIESDLLS